MFVVPKFEELFDSFGADLPALTSFVIDLIRIHAKLVVCNSRWYRCAMVWAVPQDQENISEGCRKQLIDFALKAPVIGEITTKSAIARYARTLETMSAAGVPLVEAMDSVAGATGNIIYYKACLKIRDEVSQGTQLQTSMRNTGLFPNMAIQMVSIGEEAGSLDAMLSKVADFYENEVDNAVDALNLAARTDHHGGAWRIW